MTRSTENFEPNVTIGDLVMLARLSDLFYEEHISKPGIALQSEWGVSSTRVRNALLRIYKAVGPVELTGSHRRTQQPSLRGGNVGQAGRLAQLLIEISSAPQIDQSRLKIQIEGLISTIRERHEAGQYNKTTS